MKIELNQHKLWIESKPVDFRKSIDGLCAIVVDQLGKDPQKGVYVFYNRGKNRLKILCWHRNGFILLYKRLEKTRFHVTLSADKKRFALTKNQFSWLLLGIDWQVLSKSYTLKYKSYN